MIQRELGVDLKDVLRHPLEDAHEDRSAPKRSGELEFLAVPKFLDRLGRFLLWPLREFGLKERRFLLRFCSLLLESRRLFLQKVHIPLNILHYNGEGVFSPLRLQNIGGKLLFLSHLRFELRASSMLKVEAALFTLHIMLHNLNLLELSPRGRLLPC